MFVYGAVGGKEEDQAFGVAECGSFGCAGVRLEKTKKGRSDEGGTQSEVELSSTQSAHGLNVSDLKEVCMGKKERGAKNPRECNQETE